MKQNYLEKSQCGKGGGGICGYVSEKLACKSPLFVGVFFSFAPSPPFEGQDTMIVSRHNEILTSLLHAS